MASNPITMKRDGSGSLAQKLLAINPPPGYRNGTAYHGLIDAAGNPSMQTVQAGIPIFVVTETGGVSVVDTTGWHTFASFCAAHGIASEEEQHLLDLVSGLASGAYYAACVPVFSPTCVLCSGPGGAIVMKGRSLLCRVGHQWLHERAPTPEPVPASASIALVAGAVAPGVAYYAAFVDLWPLATQNADGTIRYRPNDYMTWPPWPKDADVAIRPYEHWPDAPTETVLDTYGGDYNSTHVGELADFLASGIVYRNGDLFTPSVGSDFGYVATLEDALAKISSVSGISAFYLSTVFPEPGENGKAWRSGRYFDADGHLVLVATDSSAKTLGAEPSPIGVAVATAQVGTLTAAAGYESQTAYFKGDANWPPPDINFRATTATDPRQFPYIAAVGEHGHVAGEVYAIALSTGTLQHLPADSYIGVAVRATSQLYLSLDGDALTPISEETDEDGVTIYRFRIPVGDHLGKADDGLADGQTATLTLETDGFSGRLYGRTIDLAAEWNGLPTLAPAGEPDFSTWEPPQKAQ